METLFGQTEPAAPPGRVISGEGPFAAVALEQGIDRLLDYSIPARLRAAVRIGQLVKVPLGSANKSTRGYVISIHPTSEHPKIKPMGAIEDERVLVPPKLMELARWMSRYYVSPLGIVLDSVIPSAVKKRIGMGYSKMVRLSQPRDQIQEAIEKTRAPKRRAVLARLLLLEPEHSIELTRLASESGTTAATVRKLAAQGLINIIPEADLPRLTADMRPGEAGESDITLNSDQQKVFDALVPKMGGGFSVTLLHGVTGSGKTEIYLQAIRRVIAEGKQAIVLVPEIALTPQTVRRFTARFGRVAILHSGLSATERHRFWQQISTGQADVVVGARSAVFAPLSNLGMIVIDEEHEASYKQDTAPRYNARDVAIKRAQLENIPILLGSATPSLESYHRACRGDACVALPSGASDEKRARQVSPLLTLPSRVHGLELAHIELVDMKLANRFRRGVHLISERLEHMLRTTIAAKKQAILLLNRRGYSNFVYCASCANAIQCKYCDTTMTYHRAAAAHPKDRTATEGAHTGQLHCHYCLAVNPLPVLCPVCNKKLSLFGLGTQRVEEELARKIPELKFVRVDSDSMRSSKDYEAMLAKFASGEIQAMLGTQMIAKGLDYPNVTLVGVISGDTALSLPDFRAAERTFQLITQVAGRAGRGQSPGRVILQTFMPDDPTIQAAIKQDYVRFATTELKHRRDVGLPPYTRMVRIILRDEDQEKLLKLSEELAAAINDAAATYGAAVKIRGPMPCAISRIAGYWRNQVVLTSADPGILQRILATAREKGALAKTDRIAVDVDPTSLL